MSKKPPSAQDQSVIVFESAAAVLKRKAYYWTVALAIFAALVVIAVAIVAIMGIVFSSNAAALQRYCIRGDNVTGALSMDINDRSVKWDLQYLPIVDPILSLSVHGPIPYGLGDAPLFFALCGSPSSLACDLTTPNKITQTITQLSPEGTALKSYIEDVRREPWRYYLVIQTAVEELRFYLDRICGSPP